ncbi:hypothetical protein J2Z44_003478 [Clostridium punense]|uniref:Uncharacterized protein n=1 Tax=Clostridium punense TaxID=1054297 RepID=A0ABS4K770_9CLOT|nr:MULTISPECIES: hypothetical protein [Clostridium]EQB86962.1 hypothetical protein M918_11500 [Clostridium sp. BL8]MBP2023639.1 hypothetical protein [Clostridium punense]
MDRDTLKSLDVDTREKIMREELGEEKCKIIDKYNLHPNNRLYWERRQEKYPVQEYFSHNLALKASPLGMVFHIYRLCYAKTKYFESNWQNFKPCTYSHKQGFVESEIHEMEYIKQSSTKIIIDLRELAKIKWLSEFKELCKYLEERHEEVNREKI